MDNIIQDKQKSINSILRPQKMNDILEFLIVLDDFSYLNWCCCGKSSYDLIDSQKSKFPGKLIIISIIDLYSNTYIIDGHVQIKTLYIKMPKENMYVDSYKYQEKQFNSKFNELISIFSELNAKKVNFYFHNTDEESFNLESKLKVKVSDSNVYINKLHSQKIQKKMYIEFDKRSAHNTGIDIDIKKFGDKSKFFYLPKEFEWIEIIRNRVNGNMKIQKYSFVFSDDYAFSSHFYNSLKALEINFAYMSSKFNEIKIEYQVEYY